MRASQWGRAGLIAAGIAACVAVAGAATQTWTDRMLFVGVGDASYNVYTNAGGFVETIVDPAYPPTIHNRFPPVTTGCAFNPAKDHLYTTEFNFNGGETTGRIAIYDNSTPHTNPSAFVPTSMAEPESVVFNKAGNFFVGGPEAASFEEYNAAGVLQALHTLASPDTGGEEGTDWMDLSADGQTMFITSEGRRIMRFSLASNTQLSDFAVLSDPNGFAYALRVLPGGGLLLADSDNIKQFDANGAIVATYNATDEINFVSQRANGPSWFAINLDPDGVSFWSGGTNSGKVYKFPIHPGTTNNPAHNLDTQTVTINTGAAVSALGGICLRGEPIAALSLPGRMTGGGAVSAAGYGRVTQGFELHCDASESPNNLEVNWGHNRFHLTQLTSAACTNKSLITPKPPNAGFDTYRGAGTGEYDGISGATAQWTFTDAGEPGRNDTIAMTVWDATHHVVLSVPATALQSGNHQAH